VAALIFQNDSGFKLNLNVAQNKVFVSKNRFGKFQILDSITSSYIFYTATDGGIGQDKFFNMNLWLD
jgi:hypothetical protein